MRTIVVTGAASGMGAASAARLRAGGDRVIGVDIANSEVESDLGTADGRQAAIDGVLTASEGHIDGLVTFAGIGGFPSREAAAVASINYFGTVRLLEGLRPALAGGQDPAAVAISSNSTTCQPGIPADLVQAFVDDDEERARALATEAGPILTYPASKMGVARWVRHHAVAADWAGAGICLNAIAPGMVETPLVAEGRRDPELAAALAQFPLPIGRPGRAEELAGLVVYLLGPDARFFCGSVVLCDGGTEAVLRPDAWPAAWEL